MKERIPNWQAPTIEELEATVKCLYCIYEIDPEWCVTKETHESPDGFFEYEESYHGSGSYVLRRLLTDRDIRGLQLIYEIQVRIHEEKMRRASGELKMAENKLKQESSDMEAFMKYAHSRYGI